MTFKVIQGQGQGQEMTSVPLGTILCMLCVAVSQYMFGEVAICYVLTIL